MDVVTTSEVRHYILDRTSADNDLDQDVAFSDEEILNAMKRAARDFNSLPPPGVFTVNWNRMPLDTNIFLDATAMHLYIAELGKLRRNDIDYNAGGVATNLQAKRIEHFQRMIEEYRKSWTETANNVKRMKNLALAFRVFN